MICHQCKAMYYPEPYEYKDIAKEKKAIIKTQAFTLENITKRISKKIKVEERTYYVPHAQLEFKCVNCKHWSPLSYPSLNYGSSPYYYPILCEQCKITAYYFKIPIRFDEVSNTKTIKAKMEKLTKEKIKER